MVLYTKDFCLCIKKQAMHLILKYKYTLLLCYFEENDKLI